MKISLFAGDHPATTKYVDWVNEVTFENLAEVICDYSWSPSRFGPSINDKEQKVFHRHGKYFKSTDLLVLDVDDGCTLDQAKKDFAGYQVIIATTRNHRRPKQSGKTVKPPCDRFRVILFLSKQITSKEEYLATWLEAEKRWPYIDPSCKDTARFYRKCRKIIHSGAGDKFSVFTAPSTSHPKGTSSVNSGPSTKGKLFASTWEFIANGSSTDWHRRMYRAAMDLKAKGYSIQEATDLLRKATRDYDGDLDEKHDRHLIRDVYENRVSNFPSNPGASTTRTFSLPTSDEIKTQMKTDRELRKFALANSLPFVCSAFDEHFKLTLGLILLLGKSGAGKSTLVANIIARVIEENSLSGRKILVITNEETTEDVYSRVACLVLGKNWKKYRNDQVGGTDKYEIGKLMENLVKELVVIPAQRESWDMTAAEDVESVLNYVRANQKEYGMVLIDYLQTVKSSRNSPQKKAYEVSKDLGFFLKQFAQACVTPVLLFAQLKDAREASDISSQIQNDRTIYNHAQTVVELKPDFENSRTTFVLHKQRWGERQGLKIECEWSQGRFEPTLEHSEVEEEFSGF